LYHRVRGKSAATGPDSGTGRRPVAGDGQDLAPEGPCGCQSPAIDRKTAFVVWFRSNHPASGGGSPAAPGRRPVSLSSSFLAGCAALSHPTDHGPPGPPGGPHRLESLCYRKNRFWFPSSRLGTPLQAKLLLCERIIYLLHQVPQAGAWERGKGGMRCAFPPYGLTANGLRARQAVRTDM